MVVVELVVVEVVAVKVGKLSEVMVDVWMLRRMWWHTVGREN